MFDVVIIGTDINAYYMARNFHEEYNIKPHLIGKEKMLFTHLSNILTYELDNNLWDSETFTKKLEEYALSKKDKKIILVASNDHYVRLIVENKAFLEKYYLFIYPDLEIINNLLLKDNFYKNYKDSILNLPKTYIYDCAHDTNFDQELSYPIIVKPSDGVKYYENKFSNQAKVYKIYDIDELRYIINQIQLSGYKEKIIIQEFIPGDDSCLFDSILYVNKKHEVEVMSFAQIGLQEHTKTGVGNCTVLVNGYNQFGNTNETIEHLKCFLTSIKYQGIAEFDLKYDIKTKKFKVLEINPRQARSSYYLTACGHNLAKYLVDELIYNKNKEFKYINEKMLLTFVPKKVIKRYVVNKELKKEILNLIKIKKYTNPLKYNKDSNLKRKIWLFLRDYNYMRKYKNNKW